MKVYCKSCKYLDRRYVNQEEPSEEWVLDYVCLKGCGISWLSEEVRKYGSPKWRNINNNCKDYKELK